MSGWIQVDISLLRNPKLIIFAKKNKLSEMEAVGALVKIWAYSFEYGKKAGHIPHPDLLSDQIWEGKNLLEGLVEAGFIDKRRNQFYVHDWEDKYSQLDRYRKMNAKRQSEYRQRQAEEKSKVKYNKLMKDLHGFEIDE